MFDVGDGFVEQFRDVQVVECVDDLPPDASPMTRPSWRRHSAARRPRRLRDPTFGADRASPIMASWVLVLGKSRASSGVAGSPICAFPPPTRAAWRRSTRACSAGEWTPSATFRDPAGNVIGLWQQGS